MPPAEPEASNDAPENVGSDAPSSASGFVSQVRAAITQPPPGTLQALFPIRKISDQSLGAGKK
jgi:hypothetical protein